MKIAFVTLGCKVNQYETHVMEQQFSQAGFVLVPSDHEADIYVVNSCTVTATSDQKTRKTVRHYKRLHPNAVVVLTGCYSQAFPEAARLLLEQFQNPEKSSPKICKVPVQLIERESVCNFRKELP